MPKAGSKADIVEIKARFLEHFKGAKTELKYKNLYELLICVILSAQCTDKRVNLITPALFARFPDIASLANAELSEVKELIKSCSFFNNKARNIILMAQKVLSEYNGEIPLNQELLVKLPGVGQKTANVVLIEHLEQNLMAVDTHVFRVSHRLGIARSKTPAKTQEELSKAFRSDLATLHQAFVLFGRYICKALKPQCQECFVAEFCTTKQNFKPQ
ncbi:MAG: endonuclease III [Wolinella sp.]